MLLKEIPQIDALLSLLSDKIDGPIMDAAPKLRVISNMAVGFDNVDVREATKRKIMVCNTPGVLTETSRFCVCSTARRCPSRRGRRKER